MFEFGVAARCLGGYAHGFRDGSSKEIDRVDLTMSDKKSIPLAIRKEEWLGNTAHPCPYSDKLKLVNSDGRRFSERWSVLKKVNAYARPV